ncbi:putative ribonuclease H-like domain-containing protein [Tanacetum coccineum]
MTENIAYLLDFKEFDEGYVTFGGGVHGGRISGKETLKTDSLDFEDVYFVNELKFNHFSVSQRCDKKNYVLFTDTKYLVLSPNFKLPDETQILLKIPRKNNMYSFDMKNIVPKESLTYLVAKATSDESMLWHRRLGHINFKNINKLVKNNLVRGFPTKHFENDQTCVACLKGKQHRASCKSKVLNPITKPLFILHMDLVAPTFVSSLMHKKYCLVVTDDYSRFTWVFFLTTKDETSKILNNFIKEIENLVDKKVKIIRSDNGTEFKNKVIDDFCREKGIRREYSVARTLQQNGVAKRRNRTLIEAARTMLADSKLPTTFWAEAVSTACYVQNRVLVVKPHNKTPFELFRGLKPALNLMRPFGCHVIILSTLDNLGKFDGKSDEVAACTISNEFVDTSYFDSPSKDVGIGEPNSAADDQKQVEDGSHNESDEKDKSEDDCSPKEVNAVGQHVNTDSPKINTDSFKLNTIDPLVNTASLYDPDSPKDMFKMGASHTLEATHVEFFSDEDEPEVDMGNITTSYTVLTTPNTRIHKDHPIKNVIGDAKSSIQTRRMTKSTSEQGFLSVVWKLVDLPNGKRVIGTKWVFRNKKDERGIVIRNKSRLVAQGHRQEEGIDYEEVFAHVVRIKAIRLFLAYTSFMDFLVYQMDVNSAFLYETIEEEVYVTQPPGFKDPNHPVKVYKVVKVWVASSSKSMVYVDDIIIGSTNKELCTAFGKLMKDKFQMSSMGELNFFLGLQVTQKEDGIFISQDKYLAKILKKFNYTDVKSASTPVDLEKPLVKDGDADDADIHLYRSMIGSLMYLTASRPDIMFAVCECVIFQVTPKTSHLLTIKRIFRYLKGKPTLGLWYSRDFLFELVAYTDSDYARATKDRKSTTGGYSLPNQAIFDAIQRMGYEWDLPVVNILTQSFVFTQWRECHTFICFHVGTTKTRMESVPSESPSEAQPTPSPPHSSEAPFEPQVDPSPPHSSEAPFEHQDCDAPFEPQTDPSPRPSPSTIIPDSIPESSRRNLGGLSSSDKSLSGNEGEMTLQSVYDLFKHHKAWMKSVSLKQRLARKRSLKKQWVHRESVSKQGRKFAKGEPTVHKDPLFDEIPEDSLDYMETKDAHDEGRTRDEVDEEKENAEDVLSTAQQKVSTDRRKQKDSTDDQNEGTDEQSKGTDEHIEEGRATQTTQPPTSTIFGDDETIA